MHRDFTLGLALYDFLPVLLTGLAVYFLARLVTAQQTPYGAVAYVGALLVFVAGLSKALWKLNVTLTGQDLTWLANLLFPLMAPGFAFLATGILAVERRVRGKTVSAWLWAVPVVVIVAVYTLAFVRMLDPQIERGWFMPIMGLASVGNLGLTAILIALSIRYGNWGWVVLFILNVAMVFALIPIAQIEPKSIALHWIEQTISSGGAAAFALASSRLHLRLRSESLQHEAGLSQPSLLTQ